MHILIALLTAIATLLYALDRIGVDIGWVNPWAWKRRRQWLQQHHANPAFSLKNPMEAVALLLTATAKIDGDLSSEEKNELRQMFENTFKKTSKEASSLLVSSTYLIGSGLEVFESPEAVLAPCAKAFSNEQKLSTVELLSKLATVGGPPSEAQKEFVSKIEALLLPRDDQKEW